jgi:hypothetical protein
MASSIEDILMAKAMAEANAPDPLPYAVGGAAMGGLLGTMVGEIPHQLGRGANSIGSAVVPKYETQMIDGKEVQKRIVRGGNMRPGFRAAGGLVGAIMGGALGMGVRDQMIRSSPELQMMLASQQNTGAM